MSLVLHLFTEHKLTGPSRLVVDLCKRLSAPFMVNVSGVRESRLMSELRAHNAPVIEKLRLDKGSPVSWLSDARRLARLVLEEKIGLVHCHHTHDLFISAAARYLFGMKAKIVFSSYHRSPLKNPITRYFIREAVSAYITYSKKKLEDEIRYMGLRRGACHVAMPGMISPSSACCGVTKALLGFSEGDFLGVIVMRVQKHRRLDVVVRAVKEVVSRIPNLKIALLGRGTRLRELAHEPVRRNGLESVIRVFGYKEDYLDYLRVSDFFIYTSPGSDGTSRALREAMFLGKPSIVFDLYYVRDICDSPRSSILVNPEPPALASALVAMHRNKELRESMGRSAADFAAENFDIGKYCRYIEGIYSKLLSS